MRYSGDLLLDSDSGYMMPFMPGQDGQVQVRLPFGEQIHPVHGRQFHHVGVDFACVPGSELYALATGTVIGLGTDEVWGEYVICRYGVYQVRYGHLSKVMVTGGQAVRAEMVVGLSGDFLHMDVTCKGREFDPMEFLSMLYSNMQQYAALGGEDVRAEGLDMIVRTDYERDMEEITDMMVQYFPMYMKDVMDKSYIPTERTEVCLRNVFTENASKNYFFEKIPTLGNPLGLSSRAAPLAGKVQNVLIGDFLCYMAVRHGKFVSTWDEGEKKNFLTHVCNLAL